jgi:hypothetical protein
MLFDLNDPLVTYPRQPFLPRDLSQALFLAAIILASRPPVCLHTLYIPLINIPSHYVRHARRQ